jgi:hypothetical protein
VAGQGGERRPGPGRLTDVHAIRSGGPDHRTEHGHLGNFQVVARADADKGDGDEPVTAILNLTVVGGKAVTGTMRPGTPYEQV